MASFGIGAKLRQERVARGLTIDDIARETRIKSRFLDAIEAEDFNSLPGLVFARNFVRQFALSLRIDPDPLVSELPKPDETTIQLPDPPAYRPSSYEADRRMHSAVWLGVAILAGLGAWFHFEHSGASSSESPKPIETAQAAAPKPVPRAPTLVVPATAPAEKAPAAAVQVVLTAQQPVWIQVSADGKNTFTGTLQPQETKEVDATGQVKLLAGNAGGLSISLNGKTLKPLGSVGEVRAVRLTAEGPELLARDPQPAPDPL